ncbi:MAG: ABC transporter permease [Candidatus Pacearchaeota archaeon]
MIKDYFLLALKNLKHRGIRSWLTMLGIFIGIASVVSLISLGNGLQTAITSQFNAISTDTLVLQNSGTGLGPPGSTAVRKLNSNDVKIIKSVSGVREVIPRLIRIAKVEHNRVLDFSYIANIPEKEEQAEIIYSSAKIEIKEGRLLKADDRKKVVLGDSIASNNKFGKEIRVGSKIKIQDTEFEVVGILKRASSFQINSVILMPEKDMKEILDIRDEIDIIIIKIEDKNKAEEIAREITRKIREDRNQKEGEEDFSLRTPLQSIESVNRILNIVNLIVVSIAAISLLVGGIGITNTMYTSVLERTKEIGIMKAIGAQNKDILLIFLIEAGLLGLVGGIVGVVIGLSIAIGIAEITNSIFGNIILEVTVSFPLIIFAILFSLIVGTISGLMPAIQASRLKPVEALRK